MLYSENALASLLPPSVPVPAHDVSRHKCLIYEGNASEQLPVVVPFLLDGLRSNWRCLYVGAPDTIRMVDQSLSSKGVHTFREAKRGALILSSDRSHLNQGEFNPQRMVDWLSNFADDAVQSGFEGLCATGDMRWELGEDENFKHLLEYEASLEQLFREKPIRGICQYHRESVPAQAVQNALVTHRSTYVGSSLKRDNFFYIPPELILQTKSDNAKVGEWMCQQIIRVVNAENVRDKALDALKASEAQQRRLAEQLAEMNGDLERRVHERTFQLEQSNRELEAFSYSVSHDLRSPLQHINGFAALLEELYASVLDEKGRDYLSRIQDGSRNMSELINDLLRLAKLAQTELKIGRCQLSVMAKGVMTQLRFKTPGRQVQSKIEENLEVQGDLGLLRVALENLLSNAWKYSSKASSPVIEFGAVQQDEGTVYFVRDNGAGFDMQHADKLFMEFAGHGVGLATVRRIIHRHNGRIWAEAQPGRGATFFFTLGTLPERTA